ncbi:hypothetical protein ILUMI_22110 [Ignelater luminosus]|uniref:C-type lectin n=1 Tax=Ignelater luminosus TaxID=2038154 RepID=A0A8K0CB77_IGNLU|nr:hypothetical protein ILUMI_22110 [Ignelater luminosus]
MAILLLAFLNFILTAAYDRSPHRMEVLVERFKFGDYYFIFYSKPANWAEANTICQATRSRLAVVNSLERAKFLARALSQTKSTFEDVWIGGRFSRDAWQWISTGKLIPAPAADGFPPWLSYPTIRGKNCLSLDRRNHWDPLFVELRCNLYRPFICEESISGSLDKFPDIATETIINNRHYFLYHGRVTWQEALAFCKQSETQLAVIPDVDTAWKLAELMKRTRPPFENVWIGARKDMMGWMWVPTQQMLSNETGKNGYPPWRFDSPMDNSKSCVILDHHPCLNPFHIHTYRQHVCEEAVFIEESCGLKKDFLCETPPEDMGAENKSYLLPVDQVTYIFYEEALSWEDALQTCEKFNMSLATPDTVRQWQSIITKMGDLQRELYHIWLGGRWIPNEWVWLNNRSIPMSGENETYPPWCMSMPLHEDDEDCLNLDRDAHNAPLIYGFNCSMKQAFVCQIDGQDYIEPPPQQLDGEFEFYKHGLKHIEADWACKYNHTHLATVNNSDIAQKIALIIPRNVLVWIGAKRIEGVWRWLETREIIPDVTGVGNYPPWENAISSLGKSVCLAMKAGYREQPYFVEKPCSEKLYYICQRDKREFPQPDLSLKVDNISYYFYTHGVTWAEAMSTCNIGNMHLINIGNLDLARFLLDGMTDSVPIWTSGKQVSPGSWTWITSGTKLPDEIKRSYPPWANNTIPNDPHKLCLQLNRTEDDAPVFEGEECLQNRSFVCVDNIVTTSETEIEMDNITVSLPELITNIENAKRACLANGKKVMDFAKVDKQKLIKLFKTESVKSFWVDVIHNTKTWVYSETMKEFKSDIDFPERNISSSDKICLTLQLADEHNPILVPSHCSDFSRMLCVSEINETKTAIPPRVDHVINETVKLTAFAKESTYTDAVLVCNDLGGETVNEILLNTSIEFFKTLHPAYKSFWIGARLENRTWVWADRTSIQIQELPDPSSLKFKNETYTVEKFCLLYNRSSEKLEADDCLEKHSTVCEKVDLKCPPKPIDSPLLIWPEKCTQGPVAGGTVCRAKCASNANLIGPETHVCSKGKWSFNYEVKCRPDKNFGKDLTGVQKQIQTEATRSFFLFIIDCGIPAKTFKTTLQFTKNLANTVPLGSKRRVSIQLYSRKSKVYNMLENNNCYLIKTVDEIDSRYKPSRTSANYYNALVTAESEIEGVDAKSSYIFFFAMRPDTGSMNRTVIVDRLKKKGVIFVLISIGDDVNRNVLEEMSSIKYGALQLYLFKTIRGMKDASMTLKKSSHVRSIHDCANGAGVFG